MKALKIFAILIAAYVGLVVVFESLIGILQPSAATTLVITTFDADGSGHDRVVSRLEAEGQLYVAANHWPRAWFDRALENPEIEVTTDGPAKPYRAVPVPEAEHGRVDATHPLPLVFRFLTGFPPRAFIRLEPR